MGDGTPLMGDSSRLVRRRDFATTIMRSRRWDCGPVRVLKHRVPPEGVDPYGVGFNQHDDANYPRTSSWVLAIGPLTMTWEVNGYG